MQSGNIANTYVSVTSGFSGGLGNSSSSIQINQFYYDFGNNRILFMGTVRFPIPGGGGFISVDRENTGDILRGVLVS